MYLPLPPAPPSLLPLPVQWPEESCCERKCRRLLDAYDSHHTLYKERVGRGAGKCSPLQLSLYLSFPGFLRWAWQVVMFP